MPQVINISFADLPFNFKTTLIVKAISCEVFIKLYLAFCAILQNPKTLGFAIDNPKTLGYNITIVITKGIKSPCKGSGNGLCKDKQSYYITCSRKNQHF
jgi:hypothetical protein